MQIAGAVFATTGLAYLGWCVYLALEHGVDLNTWLMPLIAAAFIYQGYALRHLKVGTPGGRCARWGSFLCAVMVVGASAVTLNVYLGAGVLQHAALVPAKVWVTIGVFLVLGVAFAVAAILIALGRPHAPLRAGADTHVAPLVPADPAQHR